jgi:hypothetical protein
MVMIAFVGQATFDKSGTGATSILQAGHLGKPQAPVEENATLAPCCSYYASCAAARGGCVCILGTRTLGKTYRIPATQGFLIP